ncbi:MAG: hypothetical protein ACR2G9_02695 [Gaiellaceae bacterium]
MTTRVRPSFEGICSENAQVLTFPRIQHLPDKVRRLSVWRLATAAALRLPHVEITLSGCYNPTRPRRGGG